MESAGFDQLNDHVHLIVHPTILRNYNEVKQCLINSFIQKWESQLQSTTGKLRLYKIKIKFSYENYLEFLFIEEVQ